MRLIGGGGVVGSIFSSLGELSNDCAALGVEGEEESSSTMTSQVLQEE